MAKETKAKEEEKKEEVVETSDNKVSEKELLKQAEEKEKERKELDKKEKEESKKQKKVEETKVREEKVKQKAQVRVKPRHGKKYREIVKKIEKNKTYTPNEAITLVLETNPAKFDATVEIHIKVNEKEKNVRGTVKFTGGVAKEKNILSVDESNIEEVVEKVKAGKVEFDIMVASMKVMPKLAQLAKILGPKGLMPSPKSGTVVEDVKAAAEELKGGKAEYRTDKSNIIHMPLGKISFGHERIMQNFTALIDHMPTRIDSIYLTTTMGPSVKVSRK